MHGNYKQSYVYRIYIIYIYILNRLRKDISYMPMWAKHGSSKNGSVKSPKKRYGSTGKAHHVMRLDTYIDLIHCDIVLRNR